MGISKSERRFVIYEAKDNEELYIPTIRESEFHRRIYLAFRAAFCTLDETIDYDKAVEIIVHGEGENQHDLPGCEDEAGPNWKGKGKKGEVRKQGHSRLIYDKETRTIKKESGEPVCLGISDDLPPKEMRAEPYYTNQPSPAPTEKDEFWPSREDIARRMSPAPTREEWEKWADKMPSWVTQSWEGGLLEYEAAMNKWFLSMPIVPRGK